MKRSLYADRIALPHYEKESKKNRKRLLLEEYSLRFSSSNYLFIYLFNTWDSWKSVLNKEKHTYKKKEAIC